MSWKDASDPQLPPKDDQGGVTIGATAEADLSLSKSVSDSTPVLNTNVTFTITLSNAGPAPATNVSVLDDLPAGLAFVSATASSGSYDPIMGVWSVAGISVGAWHTLQIVARVTSSSGISNVAEIMNSDQTDPDSTPGNGSSSEDDQSSVSLTAEEVVNVPTVSELGLFILALLLGLSGVFVIRR